MRSWFDRRRLRGQQTADNYRNRLTPVIEFAEQPEVLRRWPLGADIDRDFVVRLRSFLHQRRVTRNGRAAADERPHSPGQIYNILDCADYVLLGAPAGRATGSVDDQESIHPRTRRRSSEQGSAAPVVFPLDLRIRLVALMDTWQLCQLGIALVLPLRPEDYTGLLLSEVDFTERLLHFGSRLEGWDFNKGQQNYRVPFPPELEPLLHRCVDGRSAGPLLRQRTIVDQRRRPKLVASSIDEVGDAFTRAMAGAKPGAIQAKQDGKRLFRRLLREMGGVSSDSLGKEFQALLAQVHFKIPPEPGSTICAPRPAPI